MRLERQSTDLTLFDAPPSFWIVAAILTALCVAAALWPLWRRSGRDYGDINEGTRHVLIAELDELERDQKNGLIDEDQSASARAEIGRRLLALEREEKKAAISGSTGGKHRLFQAAMIILIPLLSLAIYGLSGAPGLSDQPIAVRLDRPAEEQDIAVLVARTEKHLLSHPNDLKGWRVLAPIYMRMGRLNEAVDAYRQILNINPEDKKILAEAQGNLAQVLTRQANGLVTHEALGLFQASIKNNPDDPVGFFFEALYYTQQNDKDKAIPLWTKLIETYGVPGVPWLDFAKQTLAQLKSAERGPIEEDVAAVQKMTPDEQRAFIETMVERLAARLEAHPNDLTGWSRLIQAYMMLEKKEQAVAALTRARAAFSGKDEALSKLDAVAKNFEL